MNSRTITPNPTSISHRQSLRAILCAVLLAIVSTGICAERYYVDPSVSASGDGTTWSKAFRTIGEAVSLTSTTKTKVIWVAGGTYGESLVLPKGATLYGGFAGGETTITQRNIAAHPSVIDGKNANVGGTQAIHVVTTARDTVIDGFTITGGHAGVAGMSPMSGGGVYSPGDGNSGLIPFCTISNCLITSNYASFGGGLAAYGVGIRVEDSAITSNTADHGSGGGAYADGCGIDFTSCSLVGNSAMSGGGFFGLGRLTNCVVSNNSATHSGGGVFGDPEITGCVIADNTAVFDGGGICSSGYFTLADSIVSRNSAQYGGGVRNVGSVVNCTLEDNSALQGGWGGALMLSSGRSPVTMERVIFGRNTAYNGGAVYASGISFNLDNCVLNANSATNFAGGIYSASSGGETDVVRNCTLCGNAAGLSGGAVFQAGDAVRTLSVTNSILAGSSHQAVYSAANSPKIALSHNLFHSNPDGDYYDKNVGASSWSADLEIRLALADHNLVGDPLFSNAAAGDFHLLNGSAAIDRGTTTGVSPADLDGNPRPGSDGLVDIGAYEAPAGYLPSSVENTPPASRVMEFAQAILYHLEIPISLRAADTGSGVQYVELYYRKDGGDYAKYPGSFTDSPITFHAPATGSYEFFTVATDWKGNREALPQSPDAEVTILDRDVPDQVLYVDTSVTASGAGTSWASAFKTIGEAMQAATPVTHIWVASGNYSETVAFKSGVSVYGGFARTESSPSERTGIARTSIFGITMTNVSGVRLDGISTKGSNDAWGEGGGVTGSGVDSDSLITGCSFNGPSLGVDLAKSSCHITDCVITGGRGGASLSDSSVTMSRCRIEGNTNMDGIYGGIHATGANTISECRIVGNESGSMYEYSPELPQGGGVWTSGSTFINCYIAGNSALDNTQVPMDKGGDYQTISSHGGGVYSEHGARFINCTITGNAASIGGAVEADTSTTFQNTIFAGNHGNPIFSGSPKFDHCLFWQDPLIAGTGNISGDPRLTGYKIGSGSAAIDAGSAALAPPIDIEGFPRPLDVPNIGLDGLGKGYDIGAYEYRSTIVAYNLSRSKYELGFLSVGEKVYTDRTYTFSMVPDYLRDALYIRGRNDDKKTTTTPFLTFDVNQDVNVYVALDERQSTPPTWLNSWQKTGRYLAMTDAAAPKRYLYRKLWAKGRVSLGPTSEKALTPAPSLYTVIIVPPTTPVREWTAYR